MSDDYLWNKSGPPDPEVARLEQLLAPLAHDAPLDALRVRRRRRAPFVVLGVVVAAAAALAIYLALPRHSGACGGSNGFRFTGVGGDVTCGGSRVASGVLPVGGQLDTGAHEASLSIADIGWAQLGRDTRVRLDRTDRERHQLSLERGHLHARVTAPPRLFAVATKHTEVVDLGCEYTIDVDDAGAGEICVHSGLVELATKSGAVVTAPEGTCAAILAGQNPGLPHVKEVSAELARAIGAYERGEPGARDRLLAAATDRDAITLIAAAAIDPQPAAVLGRLMELSPPPDAEISVESALARPEHFATWKKDVLEVYFGMWGPRAKQKHP
jgi:ferric-dicitrate binding protein FerR (iron transport regulator)